MLDVDDFKGINTRLRASRRRPRAGVRRRLPARHLRAPATCRRGSAATSSRCSRPGIDAGGHGGARAAAAGARSASATSVRISAGWVVGAPDPTQLLLDADEALAAAKRAGKDRALSYA